VATAPSRRPPPAGVPDRTDAELSEAVRAGRTEAFADLYRRHLPAARRLARRLAPSCWEADDLVSEAFTRVLDTLRCGRGPDAAFRAYLLTTLRNTLYDQARRDQRLEFSAEMAEYDPGVPFRDTAVEQSEAAQVARAYARLPERWQLVLWQTEVCEESPAELARRYGLSPNCVSALAYRARVGLRQAYEQVERDGLESAASGQRRANAPRPAITYRNQAGAVGSPRFTT
jgi:RNA polymerase sigma factor (sigma-70 family)